MQKATGVTNRDLGLGIQRPADTDCAGSGEGHMYLQGQTVARWESTLKCPERGLGVLRDPRDDTIADSQC